MGNWTTQLIPDFIAGIILLIIIPIAIAIYGWLKSTPRPYILVLIVLCFAACLSIYKNTEWKKLALTSSEIESQLHNWAFKSGYSIQSSNTKDKTRFLFILRHSTTKKKIAVGNRKEDNIYRIFIQTSLTVGEDHQKLIKDMSQEEKRHFISYIRLELLKYGIDYVGIKYPLQNITLLDEFVYDESLTRTAFLKNLMFVLRAKLLLHEMIVEKLKDIQQTQQAVSS